MNKPLVGSLAVLAIVAAAATAGYVWALHTGQADIRQAAQQIRAGLGPGGSFSYASARVHPFQRAADLSQVALRTPRGDFYTAARVTIVNGGDGHITALQAHDVRVTGASAAEGSLAVADLSARQVSFPVPPPGQPMKVDPAAITLGELVLHKLAFSRPGAAATLETLDLHDYGAGQASTLTAQDFSAPVAAQRNIDHLAFTHVSVSGLDLALAVSAAEHHTRPPQLVTRKARFEMDGLHATNGRSDVLAVQQLSLAADIGKGGGNSVSKLAIRGVAIVPPAGTPDAVKLAAIGIRRLRGGLSSEATYRLAGGRLVSSTELNVEGFGRLTIHLRMAHVDAAAFAGGKPDPVKLQLIAREAQLVSLVVAFTDQGLLNRALAVASQRTGKPPAVVRAIAVAQISMNPGLARVPNGDHTRSVLAGFMAHGGTVGLTMQPPVPISLLAVAQMEKTDPSRAIARLGLSLTGN